MKKLLFRVLGVISLSIAPLLAGGLVHAAADTCTWSGGGVDDNWDTAANWTGCDNGTVPEAGDSLVFPMTVAAADRANTNNFPAAMSFNGIQFTGTNADCTSPSYVLPGNSITLTGDVVYTATGSCPVQISLNLIAGANIDFINSSAQLGSMFVISPPDGTGTFDTGAYDVGLMANDGNDLVLNSALTGTGSLTLTGPGYLTLYGPNMSGYAGDIVLLGGSFGFDPEHFGTTGGSTTVGADASIFVCSTTAVTIAENITLSGTPFGNSTKVVLQSSCGMGGGNGSAEANPVFDFSGTITLGGNVDISGHSRDAKLSGTISGAGYDITVAEGFDFQLEVALVGSNDSNVTAGVHKSGDLQTTYTGDQSATNPYASYNNTLIVSVGGTLGNVIVGGGTLKGGGTVGTINMSEGTVAPGLSPGCLTSGALTYTGGTVQIELNGLTVCTEYDQQIVVGAVDLGSGTTLSISRLTAFVPALNSSFTIIDNDGADAVTGTFAGLAQDATTVVDGVTYTISYTGGDGNDVVLVVTAVDSSLGAPNTGFAMLKASVVLPVLAMLSGVALFGIQKFAYKKNK